MLSDVHYDESFDIASVPLSKRLATMTGLDPQIVRALAMAGIEDLFASQAHALRFLIDDMGARNVKCFVAPFAFGKTLLACLALFTVARKELESSQAADAQPASKVAKPIAVCLCPTRPMASQSGIILQLLTLFSDVSFAVVIGGESKEAQLERLGQGPDVLVATAGRFKVLMQEGAIDLSGTKFFFMDEGEEMLDARAGFLEGGGFLKDVRDMFVPAIHPTALIATIDTTVTSSALTQLNAFCAPGDQPELILLGKHSRDLLAQTERWISLPAHKKFASFLLEKENTQFLGESKVLIFVETRKETVDLYNDYVEILLEAGVTDASNLIAHIHGGMPQLERIQVEGRFRRGEVSALITSPLLARGMNFPQLHSVVNIRPRCSVNEYQARCARAGRDGSEAKILTLYFGTEIGMYHRYAAMYTFSPRTQLFHNGKLVQPRPMDFADIQKGLMKKLFLKDKEMEDKEMEDKEPKTLSAGTVTRRAAAPHRKTTTI